MWGLFEYGNRCRSIRFGCGDRSEESSSASADDGDQHRGGWLLAHFKRTCLGEKLVVRFLRLVSVQARAEFGDDTALQIQSLFPSVVLQQIQKTLATRQIVPHKVNETELVWTYFGYADDDEQMTHHRLRNINLVGPAGYISMEDGEAVELCQNGTADVLDWKTFIQMGGSEIPRKVSPMGMDETAVRGFWQGYLELMGETA